MPSIPSNITRVPNLLASQFLLGGITRTNLEMLSLQTQMASGKAVGKFSDDAIAASAISVLQDRLSRSAQRLRNLSAADTTIGYLDSTLGDASDVVLDAAAIASDQIGTGSDTTTRSAQAFVIDGMIRQLYQLANRQTNGLYIFGGSTPNRPPMQEVSVAGGGFRYVGRGSGLLADLDSADDIPVTIGGDNAIGETSARVRSTLDLNPELTGSTLLADLRGARGQGIRLGQLSLSFDGGPSVTVDLAEAENAQDVADQLTLAIRQYETDNSVTVLGPGGVSFANGGLTIDVVPGTLPDPDPQLTFTDVGSGTTAADLGLTTAPFETTAAAGADLDPRLTLLSPVSSIAGLTVPLDSIRFRFTRGQNTNLVDVDLSSAQTIDDIRDLIETQVQGVRVEINASGRGINIFSEISGPSMSIEEIPNGSDTATELGIRSLSFDTAVGLFNNGRGVRIANGAVDPVTGQPDPTRDTDFRITLGNGQSFNVDLRPQDLVSVQTVLDRINDEFNTAVGQPPLNPSDPALVAGDFTATLTDGANGIAFTQSAGPAMDGGITVERLNNSAAAEDLGLASGSYDAASATFVAQDRAKVRVNNVFTALLELADSLRADDSNGIAVAGEALLGEARDRLASARALVGVYSNRVQRATSRLEDATLLDERVKSQLQDLDYASAATRFSLLSVQLQAAMTLGAQTQQLSLLNFLG